MLPPATSVISKYIFGLADVHVELWLAGKKKNVKKLQAHGRKGNVKLMSISVTCSAVTHDLSLD